MDCPRDICVVIPTYNNAGTLRDVVARALAQCPDVFVVNDGSTDDSLAKLEGLNIKLISYPRNRGKGHALRQGLLAARKAGFRRAITLDSDGQHFPEDIPLFLEAAAAHPDAMLIGSRNLRSENMPGGNTFANKFSNFWFRIQTGVNLPDTQTGFRLYQLFRLGHMQALTSRYEAELELLVFQCWKGVECIPLKINVWYPPQGERISHFRPFADFARISLLNTVLCVLSLIYGHPRRLLRKLLR